jgi:hypothetical protein
MSRNLASSTFSSYVSHSSFTVDSYKVFHLKKKTPKGGDYGSEIKSQNELPGNHSLATTQWTTQRSLVSC